MAALATRAVVLVRFPFSDLTRAKLRPALVLAAAGRGDYVLCQITSNPYTDSRAVELSGNAFQEGSLQRTSYARPGKLFTANRSLIARVVGSLESRSHEKVVAGVVALLRQEAQE